MNKRHERIITALNDKLNLLIWNSSFKVNVVKYLNLYRFLINMKILMTHELFLPASHGGGEVIVYEITKRLKESGIDIKVLTTGNSSIKEFKGIRTIRIPINRYLMNFTAPLIYNHAKDVDLIQTNNYNACYSSWLAGKWLNKPVICLVHEVYNEKWFEMRGPIGGTLSRIVERLQVRHNYDRFLFFSEHMRRSAVRIGIPFNKTVVIKPGLEFKKFKMKKKEPYVLFVGGLIKRKGLDYLIQAAKKLDDVKFLIVGKGKERERLEMMAPKNVEFLGYVSGERLIDLYSKALIFCLPSIGEGFGLVLLEAMASGCVIVSTVPLDYEGVRIDVRDVNSLKTAIRQLVDNPNKTKKIGRKNRMKARKYNWNEFIKRLIDLYEEILNKN